MQNIHPSHVTDAAGSETMRINCLASTAGILGFNTLMNPCRCAPATQQPANAGQPYNFGSTNWPGLAKVMEEAAEVIQVAAKLQATGGKAQHWDGTNLIMRMEEELGDVLGSIKWLIAHNSELNRAMIFERAQDKITLYNKWHGEQA